MKSRAWGEKKNVAEKLDQIRGIYSDRGHYYPIDAKGRVDEWDAILKQQVQTQAKMDNEMKAERKAKMQEYQGELDKQKLGSYLRRVKDET